MFSDYFLRRRISAAAPRPRTAIVAGSGTGRYLTSMIRPNVSAIPVAEVTSPQTLEMLSPVVFSASMKCLFALPE